MNTPLQDVLTQASERIKVGARYQHYKQKYYTVLGVALLESNLEPCVIYQAQYGDKLTFVRPVESWEENILLDDGTQVARFTRVIV